jgi:hypothetical protein
VNGLDKLDFDLDFERLVFFRFESEDVVEAVFLAGEAIAMTTLREVLEVR